MEQPTLMETPAPAPVTDGERWEESAPAEAMSLSESAEGAGGLAPVADATGDEAVFDEMEQEMLDLGDFAAAKDEGLDAWDAKVDAAEDDDALVELFVGTLDDEDAFVRGLLARAARRAAGAMSHSTRQRWPWQAAAEIAAVLPIRNADRVARLIRLARPHLQSAAPQLRRFAQALENRGVEQMDVLADAMADRPVDPAELDAFVEPLAGFAARAAVRAVTTPALRRTQPQTVRAIGRASVAAARSAVRTLVAQGGPSAVRAIGPVIRSAVGGASARPSPAKALPAQIGRAAARIVRSGRPLSTRLPAVRATRARAPGLEIAGGGGGVRPYSGATALHPRTIRLEIRVVR